MIATRPGLQFTLTSDPGARISDVSLPELGTVLEDLAFLLSKGTISPVEFTYQVRASWLKHIRAGYKI